MIEPTSQPKPKPEIHPSQLEPKRNDYDGRVFKNGSGSESTERVSTSDITKIAPRPSEKPLF
jgi:hypothetical protein